MNDKVEKLIVIGSGCAGCTAAIYASRANLEPLVLEGLEPGGQLGLTTMVENYPGFPDGIMGPELMEKMKKQAERFGARFRMETATRVDVSSRPFRIETEGGGYQAESVIIASGASARLLGIPGEREMMGHGVSTCATCDGYFFRGQKVVVVGGGDTAMEDSLYLTKHAEKVTVVHRRDQLRASKIMAERALQSEKIEFLWNTIVLRVLGAGGQVRGVLLKGLEGNREYEFETDGLFVAIGHDPNTKIVEGQLKRTESGYLIVRNGSKTEVEGVFAAGDVHDHVYRQAVTAAGAGCRAAMDCERWLESQEHDRSQREARRAQQEPA